VIASTESGRFTRIDSVGDLECNAPHLEGKRIALVHDWIISMRGGERVLEQMCLLFPDADVHTLCYEPERASDVIRNMNVHELKWFGADVLREHHRKALPILPALIRRMPTRDYDIVISTSHCVAKAAPGPRRGLNASYVFSPMRYVWDHFRDYLGQGDISDTALRLVRGPLRRWDANSNSAIDTIAADSNHIARKIRKFWNREARTIYPPVNLDLFQPNGRPPDDFFLVVSALVPYKKVGRAVRAANLAGVRLVVVGDGPERARLELLAGENVEFTGWLPDEEIADLYARCRAFLYPGIEDFGITALEAQAAGRPVLAYARGGATETVDAPTTGRFFHEPDARALARLMRDHDDRDYDPVAIRRHAERFSPLAFQRAVFEWIAEESLVRC